MSLLYDGQIVLLRYILLAVLSLPDIFLPSSDSLLVNLQQSKDLVIDLLQQLPSMFENNMESGSALGAALQASYKLMVSAIRCLAKNVCIIVCFYYTGLMLTLANICT